MNNRSYFFSFLASLQPIIAAIDSAGGVPYLVGGCVRDLVLKRELKDFDIEVHELALDQLQEVLERFGHVRLVGKKFGVLRIDGFDADWSLPRRDSKGRKPIVEIDPTMTLKDACRRRDITMNAMALDVRAVLTLPQQADDFQEQLLALIIDPYGGLEDIQNKRMRAVDIDLFIEDPLRFFRVMQFIGRFEMEPDAELNQICRTMELRDTVLDVALARERIYEEFKKLLLKSDKPSLGFEWLQSIGRLQEVLPELAALCGVQQRPDYHPEGDVFVHTMQALNFAAQYSTYQEGIWGDAAREKYTVLLAIICHDLGKAVTTAPDLTAHGHAESGVPVAKNLLKRIANDHEIMSMVCDLVQYHLHPFSFLREGAGARSYRRLALKLRHPLTMRQLGLVALFDAQGRCGNGFDPRKEAQEHFEQFMQQAEKASVAHGPEEPALLGRHLQGLVPPGPKMGALLKKAYQIQIEEGIKDVEVLKQRVLE